MKKIKVAITGNIGSGKTSFCKLLEDMGLKVIYADDIAKDLMLNDMKIKSEIIKNFGNNAYDNQGLNKNYLANKVFSSSENTIKMNSIVHPAVIKKVQKLMEEYLKKTDIIFHEAALIYEAYMDKYFDFIVLISADVKIRMERKQVQSGFSEEMFMQRELNQIPEEEKKKHADFIFTNNGSLIQLKNKSELLMKILTGMLS
ncbi:MAG: dephospho-CoA kinase [Ignavibacteriaceae bacterium]|nr:dephospho-CoA kinase [Ignavibacteriaceae bacterium]